MLQSRARFEREPRAIAALNHPNIINIFDFGVEGEQQFIVSELIDGESLRSRLSGGPLPVRTLIEIATQIAVSAIVPGPTSNATAATILNIQDVSEAGQLLGTPGYMSPEQAIGKDADCRSDQFSFGLILHEMATGKRAFARKTTTCPKYSLALPGTTRVVG